MIGPVSSNRYNRDTVTWDRKVAGSPDAQGNATSSSAPGFPQTVLCRLQEHGDSVEQEEPGRHVKPSASLFSDTFVSGLDGDTVTTGTKTYRVVGMSPRRQPMSSVISFVRYDLRSVKLGVDQVVAGG